VSPAQGPTAVWQAKVIDALVEAIGFKSAIENDIPTISQQLLAGIGKWDEWQRLQSVIFVAMVVLLDQAVTILDDSNSLLADILDKLNDIHETLQEA
jgi:hypothetical protein